MGYKVIECELLEASSMKNCPVWKVVERRTELKEEYDIKTFTNKEDAKKFSRFLNLGGGFDGWTPSFFLNTAK